MTENSHERFPPLPADATQEQVAQRGRELQQHHAEQTKQLAWLVAEAERVFEQTARNGLTSEEAEQIAHLKSELDSMKVLHASEGERQELTMEKARELGFDV